MATRVGKCIALVMWIIAGVLAISKPRISKIEYICAWVILLMQLALNLAGY